MTNKEKKRINSEFKWLSRNMRNIQKKHAGKWIAVVNGKITGFGKTAIEAYRKSKRLYPQYEPLIDLVPTRQCLFL
jgi:hypothetical protein